VVSGARPLQRRRCDALDEAGQRDARELVTAAGFEQRWERLGSHLCSCRGGQGCGADPRTIAVTRYAQCYLGVRS
jgi:hypothetical protein